MAEFEKEGIQKVQEKREIVKNFVGVQRQKMNMT